MPQSMDAFEERYRVPAGIFTIGAWTRRDDRAGISPVDTPIHLPVELNTVIHHLRHEQYARTPEIRPQNRPSLRAVYYALRPILPVGVRKHLQRRALRGWQQKRFPRWPVDRTVDRLLEAVMIAALCGAEKEAIPFLWFWPDGKSGCVVMTHDVETATGLRSCDRLMQADAAHGIPSSFQLIPSARYAVSPSTIQEMRSRGFEVNVHDWNHDGALFWDRNTFSQRMPHIQEYLVRWSCEGFRSGALYRNLDWLPELGAAYDMSVPNVAHLDPQHGGCCTTFPWMVTDMLEIPVTTTQDYSLFHILRESSMRLWQQQLALILEVYGLASFIVHPDYVREARAWNLYLELLGWISKLRDEQNVWVAPPGEVNRWWRDRMQTHLVREGGRWRIEGPAQDRARIAFAQLDHGMLQYTLDSPVGQPLQV